MTNHEQCVQGNRGSEPTAGSRFAARTAAQCRRAGGPVRSQQAHHVRPFHRAARSRPDRCDAPWQIDRLPLADVGAGRGVDGARRDGRSGPRHGGRAKGRNIMTYWRNSLAMAVIAVASAEALAIWLAFLVPDQRAIWLIAGLTMPLLWSGAELI